MPLRPPCLSVTPYALLSVVVVAYPYYLLANHYRWPARDLRRLESKAGSPIFAHFSESVRGTSVIRAFGAEVRCPLFVSITKTCAK